MVKKLFKHELISYAKTMIPITAVLLGIGALTRFVWFFEVDKTVFDIIGGSSVIAFVIACIVSLVLTFIFVITRFYKNMFTNEGYLSFTLPVSVHQHILVKLTVGVGAIVYCFLLIIISVCLATAGELTLELFKAFFYIVDDFYRILVELTSSADAVFYAVETVILLIVSTFSGVLLYYACIAIGQLTKKNRVLAAVGVYFLYYFINQIISTVFIAVFSVISYTAFMDEIILYIENNTSEFVHLVFCFSIILSALLGGLYYFLTSYIMSKKLNLE